MTPWKNPALLLAGTALSISAAAQQKADTARTLDEIVISANRWEQNLNEVPNQVTRIEARDVLQNNPQTTADLLGQSGSVFIQKSQLGGGSPMIRGFATNRVLLVLDGVRLNNAIYRSGNLQNVLSVDPLSLREAEVIFGPGSLIYGSDAIGGVMDFHTLPARLSTDGKTLVSASGLARYSSANSEKTYHADVNVGGRKWSFLASATFSQFGDLRMGRSGGPDSYLRPEYIVRLRGTDSIVKNSDPLVQRFSGYEQANLLYKLRFRATEHLDLQYSFNYARTGNAPRYDRLIQYRNGRLRFAEWNYGPMLLQQHQLLLTHNRKNALYDEARYSVALQDYEESRIDRSYRSNNRNVQAETVKAIVSNVDLNKGIGRGQLFYGAEFVHNKVGSTGLQTHIGTGAQTPIGSRYPDGSTWTSSGLYASYKINVQPKLTLTGGLRYSFNTLNATFDTTFLKFPFRRAELRTGALTGNAGLVYRPAQGWQLNALVSTGYRMPNIDDIGKVFESTPGMLSVPNPGLRPEYAWNFEAGVVKSHADKYRFEVNAFYTLLDDAIVRRPFSLNGKDSLPFGGAMSRVEALQNVAKATVWGVQASAEWSFTRALSLRTHANWIQGKETDDAKNEQVPLRHAAPFYGSSFLRYRVGKLFTEVGAYYNSKIKAKDLPPSEQAKTDIYAKDADGKPYVPAWHTWNLRASYQFTKHIGLTAAWENIGDKRYRPYSSGIVAAGSNVVVSLRASL
ncbi:TonB-dependent receptor plug domain-containing protein [Flaviaesturariibacter amylovorans]|uniref:TonB-dependent receptor n=1 Tax=Flaviaesturariibacter amylovorans TaxID=1084520 RepID=A0ABP8GHP3_9BACT